MASSSHPLLSLHDSNKENICPLLLHYIAAAFSSELGWIRSPLPHGFPRSPLQDITHILIPPNIRPNSEDPLTRQACKKFKKANFAEICSAAADQAERGSKWKGLTSCLQLKFSGREVEIEEAVNAGEDDKQVIVAEGDEEQGKSVVYPDKNSDVKGTIDLHVVRVDEQVYEASRVPDCQSECVWACGMERQVVEEGARDGKGFSWKVSEVHAVQGDSKQKKRAVNLSLLRVIEEGKGKRHQKTSCSSNILKFR